MPIYFLAPFTVVLSPGLPMPTPLVYGAWIMLLQRAAMVALGVRVLATARD